MTLVLSPLEIVSKLEQIGELGLLGKAPDWNRRLLGELLSVQNGAPFPSDRFNREGVGMPLIRIRDVGAVETSTYFDGAFDPSYVVHAGDLLVGMDGDFRCAKWASGDALLNQRVCRLTVTSDELDERFLFLILQGYLDAIWKETSATTVKHLSSKSIQEIPIPLPSLEEQHKIVELLEDHLSRLDAASADVKQAKIKAAQFRASVLNFIFFDFGSKGWPLYKAADLGKWITGSTPSSKVSDYVGTDVPFITPGDILDGGEIAAYSRMISNSGADSVRRLRSNAVQLVCIGATLGKVGIARFESTSNQQINALEANEEIVLPDFAMWLLASPAMQRELWDASSSTTVPILNKGNLEKIEVRVPALSEQIKALEEFDRARLTLEHLKKDFEIMLEKSNGLRRSILQAAFTGQLAKEVVSV